MDVLILEYGFEIVILAFATIFTVGALKLVFKRQLERIKKENRKPIYEVASMLIVVLATVVWLLIRGGATGGEYVTKAVAAYGAMKVMYPLYENFKLRDLLQLIVQLLKERKKGG